MYILKLFCLFKELKKRAVSSEGRISLISKSESKYADATQHILSTFAEDMEYRWCCSCFSNNTKQVTLRCSFIFYCSIHFSLESCQRSKFPISIKLSTYPIFNLIQQRTNWTSNVLKVTISFQYWKRIWLVCLWRHKRWLL